MSARVNGDEHLKLDDLLEDIDENYVLVRAKLKAMRHVRDTSITNAVSAKELEKLIGERHESCRKIDKKKIDNFTYHGGKLPKVCYQAIVSHLWDLGAWSVASENECAEPEEDALFHALTDFLDIPSQSLNNLISEIPGIYRIWRPSMHVPGSYVHGMLTIEYKQETEALWAVETHAFDGERGVNSAYEIFEGYLIKKSRYYVIIARQCAGHSGPPRVTVIHNTLKDKGTQLINALYGFVMGCYRSNALFSAQIYMERVFDKNDAAALRDELKISAEVPASVQAKLRVRIEDGIIRF